MAKAPVKKTSPMVWVGLGIVLIGGIAFSMGGNGTATKGTPAPKTSAKSTAKSSLILPEDRDAKFIALNEPLKNAFKPIVAHNLGGLGVKGNIGMPLDLAGGEAGWVYSGMAVINGTKNGLLENSTTGEGDYVKPGEKWKRCTIGSISDKSLELHGDDGSAFTLKVGEEANKPAVGFEPAKVAAPPLQGQIGNLQVQPDPSAAVDNGNQQGNRRRRNRGNQGNANANNSN